MQTTDKPLNWVVADDLAAFIHASDGDNKRLGTNLANALAKRLVTEHDLVISTPAVWSWIDDLNRNKTYGAVSLAKRIVAHVEATYGLIRPGTWYPQRPPWLDDDEPDTWTNRTLGICMDRKPYDHERYRQCSIGWHSECSDRQHRAATGGGDGCECPCHAERAYAAERVREWNERNPIGTIVIVPSDSSEPPVATTSEAYVDQEGWPVVELDTWPNAPWLSWLQPVNPKAAA